MFELFKQFLTNQNLINPDDRVLIAVSGGVDSMVLLDLLSMVDNQIAIAHCNFGLRGEESDKDEAMVKQYGADRGIRVFAKSFDTQGYASKKGVSIQMAARDLRYQWFDELMSENEFDKLATAHHQNDRFETALYNFTKGTGIKGFLPFSIRSGKEIIIRPLMFATRQEIEDYAKLSGINWREDTSNQSVDYHRNRLRSNVIPELLKINPNLLETYENTLNRLSENEQVLDEYLTNFKQSFISATPHETLIPIKELSISKAPSSILYDILNEKGFSYVQCREIAENVDSQSGSQFYSNTYTVLIDRGVLRVFSREGDNTFEISVEKGTMDIPVPTGNISMEFDEEVSFSADPFSAVVDADLIKFPITIRNFREGDRFYPLGMTTSKKVSDFLIDEKVPLNNKLKIPIILNQEEIVWIAGFRIDNRYKVTESTKNILRLKYKEHES